MTDLAIVKEEPATDLNAETSGTKSPQGDLSTDLTDNPSQLSLIPNNSTLPTLPHITNAPNNTNSNPFGPSSYTHKGIQPPFPAPFSTTSMAPIPPLPSSFGGAPPPGYNTPFPAVPVERTQQPYPIPNPMFYAPVFGQQYANEYNEANESASPKPIGASKKKYTFTPGMQPGAYYLIPLNTPNGQSSHHKPMTPYMPLINQTESKTNEDNDENKDRTQTGSTNTNSSDTSSPQSDHDNEEHQTQPFLYQTQPFLNVLSPMNQPNAPPMNHLPFSGAPHQFPPPPLPLPYPDLNQLNNTQFSLAPIVNHSSNDVKNEDKKNIIGDTNHTVSFPMSFPPLPTNNHIMNHLNSNFDDEETMQDQDTTHQAMDTDDQHETMPIIQQQQPPHYHNITPHFNHKKKSNKTREKVSAKKVTKRIRKHNHRKKVSRAVATHNTSSNGNNYADISVHVAVPALNKMKVSPAKIQHNGRGRVIARTVAKKRMNHRVNNNSEATANVTQIAPQQQQQPQEQQEVEGQMEVAYSQQYPQVGFPYIYNKEGDNGKKFTCKFMDAISIIDGQPGFCDRQFGQKCHWMRHCLEKHVPTEMSQRYQCRECNMKYAQNSSLKEHVAICHSNKPPSFKCPYCTGDITFTRWTSVLRHCRNQHPDQDEPNKQMQSVTNTTNRRKRKRKTNENSNNRLEETMPPLNIMPSVNMNIFNNNHPHPAFVAGVAILPPDLHRTSAGGNDLDR